MGRYVRFEPSLISDALSGLAGMTAAVLGIVITVVSLLVQLTSERYTGIGSGPTRGSLRPAALICSTAVEMSALTLEPSAPSAPTPRSSPASPH